MEVVEDCSRTTMQAEYEVYRNITSTNRKIVMIRPGTPLASIAVPAGKKFLSSVITTEVIYLFIMR
jgi:hypothetical protein